MFAPAPCSIMRAEAELLASGVLCTTPAQLAHNVALQLYFLNALKSCAFTSATDQAGGL